jgi:hypothetical protein
MKSVHATRLAGREAVKIETLWRCRRLARAAASGWLNRKFNLDNKFRKPLQCLLVVLSAASIALAQQGGGKALGRDKLR